MSAFCLFILVFAWVGSPTFGSRAGPTFHSVTGHASRGTFEGTTPTFFDGPFQEGW